MDKQICVTKIVDKSAHLYVRFRSLLLAFALITLALISLQKFLWTTQIFGIGIRTDSVGYLWSAENLVKGIGLGRLDGAGNFRPYTHWPPLYPILLAGFDLIGYSNLESARLLGAICIVLLTIMTGLSFARSTNHSPWYVAGALVILNSSPNYWNSNIYAMTEPLYMILSLSALLLLDSYFGRKKNIFLVLASLFIGLALITRYVGFSLLIACWLVLFFQKGCTWRRKVIDGLLMGLLALVPIGIWIIRNMLVAGTATNRTLSFVKITPDEWASAGGAILNWFAPIQKMTPMGVIKPLLILSLAFLVSLLFFRFVPRRENETKNSFIELIAVYTISYTISVVVARLLFDPSIPLSEDRIQYPLFLGFFMLIIYGLNRFQLRIHRSGWFLSAIIVCIYIFAAWVFTRAYTNVSMNITFTGHNAGFGLVRGIEAYNPLLSVLERYPLQNNRYFTDNIDKLYFLNSIYSYQITSNQSDEVEKVLSEIGEYGAVMVLFDQRAFGPEYQAKIPGMQLVYHGTADVYAAPGK
jgi:hypothetical protein